MGATMIVFAPASAQSRLFEVVRLIDGWDRSAHNLPRTPNGLVGRAGYLGS